MAAPGGGTGVGVSIVNAPSGAAATDPNAVVKPVGPVNTALPAAEKPAEAPDPGQRHQARRDPAPARHRSQRQEEEGPKADLSDESSSKKKKKKGLSKLNPF